MEHDFTESGLGPAAEPEVSNGSDAASAGESTARAATGEPRVDDVLRQLDELADLPVSEHPPIFERIHGQLVEVLGELRSGPDGGQHGRQAS